MLSSVFAFFDRIGGIITNPKRNLEILVLEGYYFADTVVINLLAILYFLTYFVKESLVGGLISFGFYTILWFAYIFILHKVITSVYKMGGLLSEYYHYASYSLLTISLLVVARFVANFLFNLILLAIWFIWFNVMLYYSAKAYYKIDVRQYIAAFLISVAIVILIIIAISTAILLLYLYSSLLPW